MLDEIQSAVDRLSRIGLRVADLCRQAEIARSTWDRWARGETEPNFSTWRRVQSALRELEDASRDINTTEAAE